jgi:TolB-like protein
MAALPPDADAVRAQLQRILVSPGFTNADRLSRFLRFVVERTLDGEGDQLKEYRLGTEVFDRPADYDPRLDSIVRVEARRLRSKLAEYYEGPGRSDPTVIRVDKGGYAAAFETATPESSAAVAAETAAPLTATPAAAPAPTGLPPAAAAGGSGPGAPPRRWLPFALAAAAVVTAVVLGWGILSRGTASASSRIQVAVLPLARYDEGPEVVPEALADAVTDGLIAELARHPAVDVASRTSVMPFRERRVPLSTIATTLAVQAVVEGRIQVTGSRLWVEVRLVDAKRDRKVWVDDFAGTTSDRRELERRVAAALARVLIERFPSGVE